MAQGKGIFPSEALVMSLQENIVLDWVHMKEMFIPQSFHLSLLLSYLCLSVQEEKKLETAADREWQWSNLHTRLADKDAWASRHLRLSCLASMQRIDRQMRHSEFAIKY